MVVNVAVAIVSGALGGGLVAHIRVHRATTTFAASPAQAAESGGGSATSVRLTERNIVTHSGRGDAAGRDLHK